MQAATVVYQTVPVVVMPSPLASSQPVVQPQYAIGPQEPAGDAITSRAVPRAPPPPVKNSGGSGLYGWMDDAGNTHLTDRWEDVPPGYRDRAKRYAS
jgi:hypothetical protein